MFHSWIDTCSSSTSDLFMFHPINSSSSHFPPWLAMVVCQHKSDFHWKADFTVWCQSQNSCTSISAIYKQTDFRDATSKKKADTERVFLQAYSSSYYSSSCLVSCNPQWIKHFTLIFQLLYNCITKGLVDHFCNYTFARKKTLFPLSYCIISKMISLA